jgi:hypothetical protein
MFAQSITEAIKLIIRSLLLPSFWLGVGLMFMGGFARLAVEIAKPKPKKTK